MGEGKGIPLDMRGGREGEAGLGGGGLPHLGGKNCCPVGSCSFTVLHSAPKKGINIKNFARTPPPP